MNIDQALKILEVFNNSFTHVDEDEDEAIKVLIQKIKELEEDIRRVYFADGTSKLLESAESVIKYRIICAKTLQGIKELLYKVHG